MAPVRAFFGPVFILLALASCSPATHQRAADYETLEKLSFKPPQGWVATSGPLEMRMWTAPDRKSSIAVFRTANVSAADKPPQRSNVHITICGHQPAIYYQERTAGSSMRSHGVETIYNGDEITSLYVFPSQATPDPAAEKSLLGLCLR